MDDDGIRETQGMSCKEITIGGKEQVGSVVIWETEQHVAIKGGYESKRLTPAQARYLADKLNRLADRIDARQA